MEHTVTLIYPFRNRDSIRVKNSLQSLALQKDTDFEVIFIDFGSDENIAKSVKEVVTQYPFASYHYTHHIDQPWNKCKAINIALGMITTSHCFISDVDMIYHPDFITILKQQSKLADTVYFQVGYLTFEEKIDLNNYENIHPYRISNREATGLTLFNTKQLLSINGFDQYYHFWSSEDTDAHIRIEQAGYTLSYYDEKLLIKHQPHPTFRSRETKELTQELRMSNAVRFNQQRMFSNQHRSITYVDQKLATIITEKEYQELFSPTLKLNSSNAKHEVLYYLYEELKRSKGHIVQFTISEDHQFRTLKYKMKEILGKVSVFPLSMKAINDAILLEMLTNYRDSNYSLRIQEDLKTIIFSIDLRE